MLAIGLALALRLGPDAPAPQAVHLAPPLTLAPAGVSPDLSAPDPWTPGGEAPEGTPSSLSPRAAAATAMIASDVALAGLTVVGIAQTVRAGSDTHASAGRTGAWAAVMVGAGLGLVLLPPFLGAEAARHAGAGDGDLGEAYRRVVLWRILAWAVFPPAGLVFDLVLAPRWIVETLSAPPVPLPATRAALAVPESARSR